MHIAASSRAQLSFGAIGGVIFDLQLFFHCGTGLMLVHEEGFRVIFWFICQQITIFVPLLNVGKVQRG